jgi:DNA polymerase-1
MQGEQLCPSFANCAGCRGNVYPKVKQYVPPKGIEIMVIGDSPTAIEAKKGRFLEGPAADILRQTMKKVGLPTDPDKVYFTTALKCAFPKIKGKQIPAEVMRNCHKHIIEEILAVQPKLVLVLGKTAIQTVYGDTSIKVQSVMGRVTPVPGIPEDIKAIPTIHPAMIQRAPGEYKPFYATIQLAANIYRGGSTYDTGEVAYQVLETDEMCDAAIRLLSTKKRVAADIETTSLDYREAEFLVMGICFEKNKVFIIPRHMRHRIKDFFAIPNLMWTWQHGKYDSKVLWRRKLGTVPLHHDVMYMHYVLDETSQHDLEHLAKVFLHAEAYKYKMNQNFKSVTLETYEQWFDSLCERVAVDADYTYQLHEVILAEVEKEPSLAKVYHRLLIPAASFLTRVEQNGILIDPELLEEYNEEYDKRLEKIMQEIIELAEPFWDPEQYMQDTGSKSAPKHFNPGSPKQMSWMIFKRLKLKPRRKKGQSTGKDVLKSIEPRHPLVDKVLEYRSVAKEQSTYVKGLLKWRDVDGRVRSTFSLHITATGRLSSKEPNVQNLPNAFGVGNIRKAVIPPKGYILMDSDYSGAELRWLACLSGCPVLTDVFKSGKNLHNETAKALFGENFTPQHKMRAKAVNFGIPYGREAQSIAEEFNIPVSEAQAMIDGWLNKYYGARDYLHWCAEAVTKGYYLQTPFGRRRRFGLVTPESLHTLQNEARNFPIQSSSSDTTLVAAMELEPVAEKYGARIINLVHDSILFEVPADPDIILEFGYIVNQHMIQLPKRLFGYEVPFASDTDIGFTWGELVGLKFDKEIVVWEEKEGDKKVEKSMPFREWLEQEREKHAYKYERDWYKSLQPLW